MSNESTLETIRRLICEIALVDPAKVQPEGRLIGYQLDSVRAVELVVAIEDTYGLSLDQDEMLQIKTVAELVSYVDKARQG